MVTEILFILGGLALLLVGAEGLVRGSAALALRLGLTPLVVGLTVVAFGTSSPELVVCVRSALLDRSALALGNVVGSNIFNFAVILGLAALIRPQRIQTQLVRFDVPVALLGAVLVWVLLRDGRLVFAEGLLLLVCLVVYLGWNVYTARRTNAPEAAPDVPPPLGAGVAFLFVAGGLGLLIGGADLLVRGAIGVAEDVGLSEAVIGLTIVAAGTSLPELAASTVAAVRGQGDLAIGNVVGSNVFNLLGILGSTALVSPISGEGLRPGDFEAMLFVSLLVLPLMWSGFRLNRIEGAVLLLLYGAYVWSLLR